METKRKLEETWGTPTQKSDTKNSIEITEKETLELPRLVKREQIPLQLGQKKKITQDKGFIEVLYEEESTNLQGLLSEEETDNTC